jgi:hypothetical protein
MKYILSFVLAVFATTAKADFTMLVPQGPGGGTSVWAEIVAGELQKYLDEDIIIEYYPGARDIPGFNEFHNNRLNDPNVIMVSHGGNAVSFLQEEVDYDYRKYEAIGLMNLNIIVGRLINEDMEAGVRMAAGSGNTPEAFAIAMLLCGPGMTVDEYIACFQEKVTWVNGMSGGDRRLAFQSGELNATRENPAAYLKHVTPNENATVWFHHGILGLDGVRVDDPNYTGFLFEGLFYQRWGVEPSGEFYEAYNLVRSFRDVLQKAMWVSADNPNRDRLVAALEEMTNNPESIANIEANVGKYEWVIGDDANALRDNLMTFITEDALQDLVQFNTEALGLASVYKPELAQ